MPIQNQVTSFLDSADSSTDSVGCPPTTVSFRSNTVTSPELVALLSSLDLLHPRTTLTGGGGDPASRHHHQNDHNDNVNDSDTSDDHPVETSWDLSGNRLDTTTIISGGGDGTGTGTGNGNGNVNINVNSNESAMTTSTIRVGEHAASAPSILNSESESGIDHGNNSHTGQQELQQNVTTTAAPAPAAATAPLSPDMQNLTISTPTSHELAHQHQHQHQNQHMDSMNESSEKNNDSLTPVLSSEPTESPSTSSTSTPSPSHRMSHTKTTDVVMSDVVQMTDHPAGNISSDDDVDVYGDDDDDDRCGAASRGIVSVHKTTLTGAAASASVSSTVDSKEAAISTTTPTSYYQPRSSTSTIVDQVFNTRLLPNFTSSVFRSGSKFKGTQTSQDNTYDVKVDIQYVDMAESYVCGCLHIAGLTPEYPVLSTFFEGEIIGSKYSFFTKHPEWGADEGNDLEHWSRFEPLRALRHQARQPKFMMTNFLQRNHIFMRWKEQFLMEDHRVRQLHGASFDGFYYICLNQVNGDIQGIYYHQKSDSRYQELHLKHVDNHGRFGAMEFR